MAHIRIVDEEHASGSVAEDYAFLSEPYSKILGRGTPTPQVYRTSSIVPEYFRFGAVQNRVLTNDGGHEGVGHFILEELGEGVVLEVMELLEASS